MTTYDITFLIYIKVLKTAYGAHCIMYLMLWNQIDINFYHDVFFRDLDGKQQALVKDNLELKVNSFSFTKIKT